MATVMGDRSPTARRHRVLDSRSIALTLGGLVVMVALFVASGLSLADLGRSLVRVPVWMFAVLVVLQGVILLIASQKWRIILTKMPGDGRALPLGDALAATSLGALAGQVLPIQLVTPPIRAWIARRHDIAAARAIGTSVFEQIFELLVLAVMAALSALVLIAGLGVTPLVMIGAVLALVATLLVRPSLKALGWGLHKAVALAPGKLTAMIEGLAGSADRASAFPRAVLLQLTSLSFLRYALLAGLNVWILWAIAPELDPIVLFLAYPLVLLVISLPIIPGGLGVVEVTWVGVLVGAGMATPAAVEAALVLRIVSTVAFLVAIPALVAFQTRGARS